MKHGVSNMENIGGIGPSLELMHIHRLCKPHPELYNKVDITKISSVMHVNKGYACMQF